MRGRYLVSLAAILVLAGCRESSQSEEAANSVSNPGSNPSGTPYEIADSAVQPPPNPKVNIPKLALACGGDGYRNGRLVFDPQQGVVYSATIIDETSKVSKSIATDGNKFHILFGERNGQADEEVIFNPKTKEYRSNYRYKPGGDDEAISCYAEIDSAKRDCAEAANIDKCIEIRHPEVVGKIVSDICSTMGSSWIDMQCDELPKSDYHHTLQMVKKFSNK